MAQSPVVIEREMMEEKLKQVLAQEDTVLFIGSGISCWSGLPSWPRLIEELAVFIEAQGMSAELVRSEAARNDLLQAASYGVDLLTKPQFAEFVRKVCRLGTVRPHKIHRRIISLGPRCFITTNYDPLVEDSLRQWQPDRFFRVVTNRQVTETADIVQARAVDFVFKPHGDANDSDSVILTREQYRVLHSERRHVLEAVETLLVSRPVVYIGFGLRDPDFLYLKDLLANTYKGGARDHYAIAADVRDDEKSYWRKNYGIHLISYLTKARPDGGKDHSPLLGLLDNLLRPAATVIASTGSAVGEESATQSQVAPQFLLALARYAGRLATEPKVDSEIPLKITRKRTTRFGRNRLTSFDRYDGSPVEPFLTTGPNRALLIGLPGAGKTYAFRRSAAKMGQSLQEACLSESFDPATVVIPFYLDLKFYTGNISEMAERTLPPDLSFDRLIQQFDTRFFIDSFNEMPREQFEAGTWEQDLIGFMQRVKRGAVIFGSRIEEGLQKLDFPVYELDSIQIEYLEKEIVRHKFQLGGRFRREILSLLEKPLFFRLFVLQKSIIPGEPHPAEFYRSYFQKLSDEFSIRFGVRVDLSQVFASIGFAAIDNGKEAIPLSELGLALRRELAAIGATGVNETEVINWLISMTLLVPQTASRLTFFHQSVTEYLGALELARLYATDPAILRQKLKLMRWDQSLFLALSFLDGEKGKAFVKDVISTDLVLAIYASKYLEADRTSIVTDILQILVGSPRLASTDDVKVSYPLEQHLAAQECHEQLLRKLIHRGGSLGGAAAVLFGRVKGESAKDELIAEILSRPDDYNFCSRVGAFLSDWIEIDDVPRIATKISRLRYIPASKGWDGLLTGVSAMLVKTDLGVLEKSFGRGDMHGLCMQIFCDTLQEIRSPEALRIATALVRNGLEDAIIALYFILKFSKHRPLPSSIFTEEDVKILVAAFGGERVGQWALGSLKAICESRPDVSAFVRDLEREAGPTVRLALRYCTSEANNEAVWQALSGLAQIPSKKLANEPLHLLNHMDLNWAGREEVLISLLKKRVYPLARPILEHFLREQHIDTEVGPVGWWLDWIRDTKGEKRFWLANRLGHFFSALSKETQARFVAEFNSKNSPYRPILAAEILPKFHDLTTDDFGSDAISFLLADLAKQGRRENPFDHLLTLTATESFVTERLLPLLPSAGEPFRSNLIDVLKGVGYRHGRRYVDEVL